MMNALEHLALHCEVTAFALSVLLGCTIVVAAALFVARLLENNAAARHGVLASAMLAVLVCPGVTALMHCLGVRLFLIPVPTVEATASPEPAGARQRRGAGGERDAAGFRDSGWYGNGDAAGNSGAPTYAFTPELAPALPPRLGIEPAAGNREAVARGKTSLAGASWLSAAGRIGLIVWAFGAALGGLAIARSWGRLRQLLRGARPVEAEPVKQAWSQVARRFQTDRLPEILSSPSVSWPAVVGFLRAVVVLPARLWRKLSLAELETILIHEAAHVLRRDQLMLHVERLATVIFWPHPLVHVLSRQLSRAREDVCDNHVLEVVDAPSYSETLLRLTRVLEHGACGVPAIGVPLARRRLEHRVSSLVNERRRIMVRVNPWILGGIVLVAALLLVAAGGTALVAQPAQESHEQGPQEEREDLDAVPVEPAAGREEAPSDGPRTRLVERLGLELEDVPPDEFAQRKTRYRGGARVVSVKPDGPSADQGIQPGDILVGLDKYETVSCEEIEKTLDRPELKREDAGPVKLLFVRGSETLYGFLSRPGKASPAAPSDDAKARDSGVTEEVMREILERVEGSHFKSVDKRKLLAAAIDGMLKSLDSDSAYLRQGELEDIHARTGQPVVGIGIEIREAGGEIVVMQTFPSSPAAEAGVRPGDVIEAIDGVAVQSLLDEDGLAAVARRIRGKPGEVVTLLVRRKDSDQRVEIRIVRSVIHIDSVHGRRLSDREQQFLLDEERGIGYIAIDAFTKTTREEFDAAMGNLESRGAKKLVLDLRGCPGGSLTPAIEIADSLIDEGTIVTLVSRDEPRQERCYTATGPSGYPHWPMVVLVDGSTASAAEILAACLQDHHRATIVGERTWGHGIVHGIFPLKSGAGAVRLATAMFVRPNGKTLHRFDAADPSADWGVKPDEGFDVVLSEEERQELRRQREQRQPDAPADARPTDRQLEKAIECLHKGMGGQVSRAGGASSGS